MPEDDASVTDTGVDAGTDEIIDESETIELLIEIPSVPLTENPEPLTLDNQIGACEDATVTNVLDYSGLDGVLYAQVECDEVTGWLERDVLYGTVEYNVGDTVLLGEDALIGFGQQGIFPIGEFI